MNINNKQQTTTKMFNSLEINSKTKHNNENVKLKKRKTEYSLSIFFVSFERNLLRKKGNLFTFFRSFVQINNRNWKNSYCRKLISFFFSNFLKFILIFWLLLLSFTVFNKQNILLSFSISFSISISNLTIKQTYKTKCWLQKKT